MIMGSDQTEGLSDDKDKKFRLILASVEGTERQFIKTDDTQGKEISETAIHADRVCESLPGIPDVYDTTPRI